MTISRGINPPKKENPEAALRRSRIFTFAQTRPARLLGAQTARIVLTVTFALLCVCGFVRLVSMVVDDNARVDVASVLVFVI